MTMQSQPVSSPKEKKFQVLVICDAEEHKPGTPFSHYLSVLSSGLQSGRSVILISAGPRYRVLK